MADDVFHATFTRNLPDIQKRGLDPLSESLWLKQGTGERYQPEPSIYSFSDPGDALRWASKMRYEFGYEDESSSPADVSIVRLRGGEHWHQDPSEDVNLGGSSRRSLQSIAPQDVLEVISVPKPAGINEEFQRAVPGGGFDEWIQYYANRINEPRPPDQSNLPFTDYLSEMDRCLKGNYYNCKLAVQQTLNNPELTGNRIKISEGGKVGADWFDKNSTEELEKNLRPGDVLNFNERHYAIYEGNGSLVQVPEWGANPERVSLRSVLEEWDPPTQIIKTAYEPGRPSSIAGDKVRSDQSNLPAAIGAAAEASRLALPPDDETRPTGKAWRGIGSLMRKRMFPILQVAQQVWGTLSDDQKEEFTGLLNTPMHELVGMDKPGIDYFRQMLGMDPEQEPTEIATLEPVRELDPLNIFKTSEYGMPESIGQVPDQIDKKVGRTNISLKPSEFLQLAQEFDPNTKSSADTIQFFEDAIRDSRAIAPPWFTVQWVPEKSAWKVLGHEGRHRVIAGEKVFGDENLPVHFFLRNSSDDGRWGRKIEVDQLSSEMQQALENRRFIPQDGKEIYDTSAVGRAAGGFVDKPLYDRFL